MELFTVKFWVLSYKIICDSISMMHTVDYNIQIYKQ